MTQLKGGCICGAVRYECHTAPIFSGNCHCSDCQKASGGGYSSSFFLPEAAVTITGDVKYHAVKGGSGNEVSRGFCPNCGSSLFGKPAVLAGLIGIRAGSLDDPSQYQPAMDIFTANAQPWVFLDPNLPKFPGMPPQ
jgi:hypothetical protein